MRSACFRSLTISSIMDSGYYAKSTQRKYRETGVCDHLRCIIFHSAQGGIISPLLANIALHGMEADLREVARTRG